MTYEPVEPVMQVAAIETHIGDFGQQRTIRIQISLHAGPSVAKFEDLPPDAREVLRAWVLGDDADAPRGCGLPCGLTP